jgi:hypothetical protein
MADIRRQQEAAEGIVYELRRGPGPRPLDPEGDARYHAQVEEAKARRNEIQFSLGARLRKLARINEPARGARTQIGLSLRVLRTFINNRFPQPIRPSPYRRMHGPGSPDLSRDPLEAFADNWVDKIGQSKRKLVTARHDKRPQRDWEEERRKHEEMMRLRSLEAQG